MWGMDGMGGMNPMGAMMMGMMQQMMQGGQNMQGGGGGCKGGGNRSSPYGGGDWNSSSSSWSKPEKAADSSNKTSDVPTIVGLKVDASSNLVANGYPPESCAIEFRKDQTIFSDAGDILQSFFANGADINNVCKFDHDPDATLYPEVWRAWKAAGQEDNCMTVATCASMGQWAVGLGGRKNADRAAKLSLALTLAAVSEPIRLKTVAKHFPLFAKLCKSAGIEVPEGAVPPSTGAMPGATGTPAKQIIDPSGTFPPVLCLKVPPASARVLQGFPQDVIAIEFDKEYAPIFSDAHHVLQEFFDDSTGGAVTSSRYGGSRTGSVTLTHDPDAQEYPELYEAWKNGGQLDNTPTVAICPSMSQWALGLGGKKNAERAAKLAMALTLATRVDSHKLQVVGIHFPQFGKLCHNVLSQLGR